MKRFGIVILGLLATSAALAAEPSASTQQLANVFVMYRVAKQCVDDDAYSEKDIGDKAEFKSALAGHMKDFQKTFVAAHPDANPDVAWKSIASGDAYERYVESRPLMERAFLGGALRQQGVEGARTILCNSALNKLVEALGLITDDEKDF